MTTVFVLEDVSFDIGSWVPEGGTKPTEVHLRIRSGNVEFILRFKSAVTLGALIVALRDHWKEVFRGSLN